MPELRELMIIAISILYTLLIKFCLLFDTAAMDLLAIYVDATLKEVQDESALDVDESALPDPDRIRRECILRHQPYALLPGSDLMRGSSAASGRSYVWPQGLSELSGLRLRRVSYTPRAVILDFGLRILTLDIVRSPSQNYPPTLVYEIELSAWISRRRATAKRTELAFLVVRKNERVFPGFGVYGSCELFGLAGIDPTISEAELFDNPSMVARLVETAWFWMGECRGSVFHDHVIPALHGGLLVPTQQQRIRCGKNAFHFFAKSSSRGTKRVQTLQTMCKEDCDNNVPFRYDIFEPFHIKSAFEKSVHLGELIFGDRFPDTGIRPSASATSPLTDMFRKAGLLNAPTRLHPDLYSPAFPANMKTNAAVLKHTAYRIQTSVPRAPAPPSEEPSAATPVSVPAAKTKGKRARKASTSAKRKATDAAAEPAPLPTPRPRFQRGVVWTAYPLHPSSLARGNIVVLTSDEMNVASFSYVVKNTKQAVVGPLEWFGNGVLVQSGKRTIIGICHTDPIAFPLSAAFNPIIAQIRGRIRNLYRAQNPGKKGVLPATTLNKAKTQISAYNKARSVLANVTNLSVSSSPSPSSSIATAQSKPRRLHADAKLIASAAIPVSSAVIASPSPPPLQAASLCNGDADTDTAADDAADASGDANTDQDNDLALAASLPVPFDSQPAPDHPVYASSGRALDGDYDDDDLDFLDEEEMSEYSGSEYEDNASLSESESGMDFDSAEDSDFEPPTKRTRFV